MRRTIWTPTLVWLAAVTGALMLALVAPNESNVMGSMPIHTVKRLDQQRIVLPEGITADRTLALVAFRRDQHDELDSWIKGLQLDQDSGISWFRMPVLNDPGDHDQRTAIENSMLARTLTAQERSRLVPVFTNRQAFIRAVGLSGTEHASVLVLDREGKVLARVEGRYDPEKAQALRETLFAQRN